MPKIVEKSFLKPTEHLRNLQVLEEISKDASISQRKLSQRLGIALGVTNACLKKMIYKGLIKVKGINHKRISYYLTPKGLSEKATLTYHFLEHTIKFYSRLKDNISVKLADLARAGHRRIVFYGAGEVLEVALIILNESSFQFLAVDVVDDSVEKQSRKVFGYEVKPPEMIKQLKPDAILVTSVRYKEEILRSLHSDRKLVGVGLYSL